MKTFGSLFTGGDLFGIGARMAGFDSIWGNEIDPKIAEIARANGSNGIIVGDVLKLSPRQFDRPDWFHASPVCTRASNANQSAELNDDGLRESPLDIAMAEKVAEFIRYLKPERVTIENVQGYKKFKAFALIIKALSDCGYMYDAPVLNCADFGVPQTRRRLVVRAVLGGFVPYLPPPVPWVGWYAAIADIIDTLPESQFAEWQLARLPEFLTTSIITRPKKGNPETERGAGYYAENYPAPTVMVENHYMKSFLFPGGGNTNFLEAHPGKGARYQEEPSHTISTLDGGGTMPRAFIVDGENGGREITVRDGNFPMCTNSASQKGAHRAFLVDGKPRNYAGELNIIDAPMPMPTLTASQDKHPFRAWLSQGRVVKMTVQALGRFQSVPDWYVGLTPKICGNGVPPLLAQRIGESW